MTIPDTTSAEARIVVENLEMRFGRYLVQREVSFRVRPGEIFVIMGGSGCGKSTLLKHMIGLNQPTAGRVLYDGVDFWAGREPQRERLRRRFGILFQSGALWSSMTLAENVALPLSLYTGLKPGEIAELVSYKLALVGLRGFEGFHPSEISGGMRKRAGLARAMALDPDILFFDEPSAGLDPLSAHRLDRLLMELRDGLGTTIVIVTHELASIFAVADDSVFLDAETRTAIAWGAPQALRRDCEHVAVREFLSRGGTEAFGTENKRA
ncbi:phospholipid/cholesterol/gamma-HCH transport system ATP-binding protein [uncultured Gammaproteobacteria bacterium]